MGPAGSDDECRHEITKQLKTIKTRMKENYEAPALDPIEISAEKGFAASKWHDGANGSSDLELNYDNDDEFGL